SRRFLIVWILDCTYTRKARRLSLAQELFPSGRKVLQNPMKKRFTIYFLAAALFCLVSGISVKADVIDFDTLTGPDLFGLTTPQTLTFLTSSGTLTITGGTILTNATNFPADPSSVYGTTNCCGYSNTITLTFTSAINNFFMDLFNGQIFTDTFTVSDNL